MKPVPALALIIGLVAAAALPARAETPPGCAPFELQGIGAAGGSPRPLNGWERDGVVYLTVDDLSRLLGIPFHWRSELAKVTLVTGERSVWVMDGSDIAVVGKDYLFHLPGPAFFWEGRMLVPLDVVVDERGAPRPWLDKDLRFFRSERLLTASSRGGAAVTAIRLASDPLGYKLRIEADGRFRFEVVRAERASFVVRLDGAAFDPFLTPVPSDHPWFQALRFRQVPGGLEIAFSAGRSALGYRVDADPAGNRLDLFLGVDERDLREGNLRRFTTPGVVFSSRVRIVALDPGHGGGDGGGREAYDLCWELAGRLRDGLGLDVYLTRDRGETVSGETRAERANRTGADLFLSLHMDPRPGGPAGFVARMPSSLPRPTPELQGLGFEPFFAKQEPHLGSSRLLAQSLVQSLAARIEAEPHGVLDVSLAELQGAAMPAVMIEVGTGDEDGENRSIRDLADGILEGLQLFLIQGDGR